MVGTSLLAALLVLPSPLFADASESETGRTWSPAERSVIDTLRLLRQKDRPPNEELAPGMLHYATQHQGLLFEILEAREVPTYDDAPTQVLSVYQEALILMTVGLMKRSNVKRFLRACEKEWSDLNGRRATIDFLGAAGSSLDFSTIISLARSADEKNLPGRLAPTVRRAIGTILRKHGGFRDLMAANGQLPVSFIRVIALAIGDVGDPRGLGFLSDALEWNNRIAGEILSQIRKVGCGLDEAVNSDVRSKVREYLDPQNPMWCRTACLASAALEDLDTLPQLILLLKSQTQGLRANAHWALEKITRVRMSSSHDNWERWYQDELTWVNKRKPLAFSKLGSRDPGSIAKAIAEIAKHPLVREDFAELLCELLDTRHPQIRLLAVQQLGELRFEFTRVHLENACGDNIGEVAEAASIALAKLTG